MLRTSKTILYPNKNISSSDYDELLRQMNQAKILYNQLLFIARQTYFSRINKPDIDDSYLDTFNIRNWDDILDINGSYNILRKSGLEIEEIVRIARENKKQGLGIKVN